MADNLYNRLVELFDKYGDPAFWEEKYHIKVKNPKTLELYYKAYGIGTLKMYLSISDNRIPKIKERYDGNIDDLIAKINATEDLDSKEIIYIPNEINDISQLNKLKETYPNKKIIIKWDDENAYIDDVISAVYMIDYFKSVINDDMSPLEKITMAYDIVKSHYYKDSDKKNSLESRRITSMVNNSYIVCVGYVRIFNRILKELGIPAFYLRTTIDKEKHARSFVKVVDEEYDLNGYYTFDPTFDSAGHEMYYYNDGKSSKASRRKEYGYPKCDSLSSYSYFLVHLRTYEKHFPSSHDEELILQDKSKLNEKSTHTLFHTRQLDRKAKPISDKDFAKLLYRVKLAEGYNIDDIPRIIQEAMYISGYGSYTINAINNAITDIQEKSSKKTA